MIDLQKDLSEVKYKLSIDSKAKYYYVMLSSVNVVFNSAVETARLININGKINIELGSSFWETINSKQKSFLLLHELFHLIFRHVTTIFGVYDKDIMNYATDFYINYLLVEEDYEFIKGGLYYEDFNIPLEIVKE